MLEPSYTVVKPFRSLKTLKAFVNRIWPLPILKYNDRTLMLNRLFLAYKF